MRAHCKRGGYRVCLLYQAAGKVTRHHWYVCELQSTGIGILILLAQIFAVAANLGQCTIMQDTHWRQVSRELLVLVVVCLRSLLMHLVLDEAVASKFG